MSEWQDSDAHPNTYEYRGFYVNHVEKFSGNIHRHEMSCTNNETKIKVTGDSFEDAKNKIIKKIDSNKS
jgi:hypothetical protein